MSFSLICLALNLKVLNVVCVYFCDGLIFTSTIETYYGSKLLTSQYHGMENRQTIFLCKDAKD